MCFPLVSDCNPDLFSLNRLMTLEQRYSPVAFVLLFIMLITHQHQLIIYYENLPSKVWLSVNSVACGDLLGFLIGGLYGLFPLFLSYIQNTC